MADVALLTSRGIVFAEMDTDELIAARERLRSLAGEKIVEITITGSGGDRIYQVRPEMILVLIEKAT